MINNTAWKVLTWVISGSNTEKYGPEITRCVIDKETWNIRSDRGKMEKLIKHKIAV